VPSPCILVIRRNDRVSTFSALSTEGSTDALIESVRRARLSHLVCVASIAFQIYF